MEESKLEVTVSFDSNLPPKAECPKTPLENLVSLSLNQTPLQKCCTQTPWENRVF